jgi:hypothetical protein
MSLYFSITGTSQTIEHAQNIGKNFLAARNAGGPARYLSSYIIHLRFMGNDITDKSSGNSQISTAVIGLISAHKPQVYGIPFPNYLTIAEMDASKGSFLEMEMGYMLRPEAWGKGYCTEALAGLIQSYKIATNYLEPYKGIYLRLIVGEDNMASCRVAEKAGFERLGLHKWDGEPEFLAGAWRPPQVVVFGMYLDLPEAIAM